jgi:CRP/FNR family cyclic AMP-dependent transcriptional regulator
MQASGSGRAFWHQLTAEERRVLQALGRDRTYPPGATICVEGDPATHVFILLSGWVKILSVTDDGRETVLAIRGVGDLVGETAGETGGHRNATIRTIEAVHALIAGFDQFSSYLDTHRGASHAYRRLMAQRWSDADTMLRIRTATTGAQRLAGLLLRLVERLGHEADSVIEIALPLSQEELASLAGTSRATVARALNSWRKRGLIRTGQRCITLIDVPGLRKAAGPAAPLQDQDIMPVRF